MANMEITPSMMNQVASEIGTKIEEWNAAVKQVYQLQTELNNMWEGAAKEEFNRMLAEDLPKYQSLAKMMTEYQQALVVMANNYIQGDNEAKTIMSRR